MAQEDDHWGLGEDENTNANAEEENENGETLNEWERLEDMPATPPTEDENTLDSMGSTEGELEELADELGRDELLCTAKTLVEKAAAKFYHGRGGGGGGRGSESSSRSTNIIISSSTTTSNSAGNGISGSSETKEEGEVLESKEKHGEDPLGDSFSGQKTYVRMCMLCVHTRVWREGVGGSKWRCQLRYVLTLTRPTALQSRLL